MVLFLIKKCSEWRQRSAYILVDIADIDRFIDQFGQFCSFFFCIFSQAAFKTDFVSDISVIYRYIGDISSILDHFFRFFQQTTFICKIVSGRSDTRNIDDISRHFRP